MASARQLGLAQVQLVQQLGQARLLRGVDIRTVFLFSAFRRQGSSSFVLLCHAMQEAARAGWGAYDAASPQREPEGSWHWMCLE